MASSNTMATVLENFRNHELSGFLDSHRTQPDEQVTMTGTTGSPLQGKWTIPDDEYEEFLDLMYDYLFVQKLTPMGFVERDVITKDKKSRRDNGAKPLLIDLDFKYPVTTNLERKFTENHIRGFMNHIMMGLKKFFNLSQYDQDGIRLFVCLRAIPYKTTGQNQVIKDGIHIESPDICLTNEKQKVLRAFLLDQHAVNATFEGTGYTNLESDVYDAAMTRSQGWYFYGDTKSTIPAGPYKLAYVFQYTPSTDEFLKQDVQEYNARELLELLSIRYNLVEDTNDVLDESKEVYDRFLNWIPPVSPSLQPQHTLTTTENIPEMNLPAQNQLDVIVRSVQSRLKGVSPEDIPLIRKLVLECLSVDRADKYDTWMEVGWCLHHIASNAAMSDELFDLWMEWSKKSPKYSANNVAQLRRDWDRMERPTHQRMLKWGSLNYWAREDNLVRYNEIIDEDLIEFIATHTLNTHAHVASIMQKMYGNQYKASIEKKGTEWFQFIEDEHIWKHINQGMDLRCKISNDVVEVVEKAKANIRRKNRELDDFSEYAKARLEELQKVEKNLMTAGFKDSVMRECSEKFREQEFISKLNMNPFLLVCKNGVLNLRATRTNPQGVEESFVEFRPGRPEDMMNFVAGRDSMGNDPIEYFPYNPHDPTQHEIEEFLTKIFPRPELRAYVKVLLSSCLEGANREQCYYTLIGVGGNGKSKIVELMKLVLGDYQTNLASTALTRKRPDSGAANPDIIALKNRRFIYLQEPDEREPLNTSRMKEFSGEDAVSGRALFGDQEKFKISGKLFMMCNNLPPINAMDRGTWRRIRVIPFESKFVSEGDTGYEDLLTGKPNVFPKDMFLDEKLKRWRTAFLSLLVWTYENIYCKVGLCEPAIVRQASNDYREQFDTFAKFRNARILVVPGERTDFNRITRAYRNWVEWQGGSGKRLSATDLRKRMEDEFGSPEEGKYFRGILAFEDEETMEIWQNEHAQS
jgi:P4 family phage/plasmid primase-like protien